VRADAQCRSCRAPIRWVIVLPKMKRMPLDPEPVEDGNMWVDHTEDGTPVMSVALSGDGVPRNIPIRYVSHFVSCPDRDSWRKS